MNIITVIDPNTGALMQAPAWQPAREVENSNEYRIWSESLENYGGPRGSQVLMISGQCSMLTLMDDWKKMSLGGRVTLSIKPRKQT